MNHPGIDDKVKKSLEGTRFSSSRVTKLDGGLVNWTYVADLIAPLEDGRTQVVIKHGEDFVAFRPDFRIGFDRCVGDHENPPSWTVYIERKRFARRWLTRRLSKASGE